MKRSPAASTRQCSLKWKKSSTSCSSPISSVSSTINAARRLVERDEPPVLDRIVEAHVSVVPALEGILSGDDSHKLHPARARFAQRNGDAANDWSSASMRTVLCAAVPRK